MINKLKSIKAIHFGQLLLICLVFNTCSFPAGTDAVSWVRGDLDSLARANPDSVLQLIAEYENLDLGKLIEKGETLNDELRELKLLAYESLNRHDSIAVLAVEMASSWMQKGDTLSMIELLQRINYDALSYSYLVVLENYLRDGIEFLVHHHDQYSLPLIDLQIKLAGILVEKNAYTEAEAYLKQAIDYCSRLNYQTGFIKIYQVLAELHFKQDLPEQAKQDSKKILALLDASNGDIEAYMSTLSDLGIAYRMLHQYDSALVCFQAILDTIPDGATQMRLSTILNQGNVYYSQNQFAEAAQRYEQVIQTSTDQKIPIGVIYGKANLSGVLAEQGNFTESIEMLDLLRKEASSTARPELVYQINKRLEGVYRMSGQYQKAYELKERVLLYEDSVRAAGNQLTVNDLEYFLARSHLALENQILSSKIQSKKQSDLMLGLLLVGLVLLSGLLFRMYQRANAYKLLLEDRNTAIAENERLYKLLLKQEREKSHLFAQKVALLNQELVEKVLRTDTFNSETFWVNYNLKFRELYPGFEEKLKVAFPRLSNQDVQYCKLIKLDLPPDVISRILNVVPHSLYRKRQRIIERMGLSEIEDVDLLDYLPDE